MSHQGTNNNDLVDLLQNKDFALVSMTILKKKSSMFLKNVTVNHNLNLCRKINQRFC